MFNITLIIFIIITVCFSVTGYKRGLQEQLNSLIVLIVSAFTVSLILMLISSCRNGETRNVVYTVIIFVLLGVVYSILSKIMKSLGFIVKLPVIGLADRLLGLIWGAVFSVLVMWALFWLLDRGYLSFAGEYVMNDIANSEVLQKLAHYNLFVR